jgi:hypothetical protein
VGQAQFASISNQLAAITAPSEVLELPTMAEEEIEATELGGVPHTFRGKKTLSCDQREASLQLEAAPAPAQPAVTEALGRASAEVDIGRARTRMTRASAKKAGKADQRRIVPLSTRRVPR